MRDDLCDNCHRKAPLKLTVGFQMLCVVCMHDQFQYPLMDALEEKKAHDMKQEALKKLAKDFNKKLGRDKPDE